MVEQTRITTKYNIAPAKARKSKGTTAATPSSSEATTQQQKPPRGTLVIKTFDPVSGATLKYKTTKAAEVNRLVLCLGRLGGHMAGVPPPQENLDLADPATAGAADEVMADAPPAAAAAEKTAAPTTGGGKGKKKKGKK